MFYIFNNKYLVKADTIFCAKEKLRENCPYNLGRLKLTSNAESLEHYASLWTNGAWSFEQTSTFLDSVPYMKIKLGYFVTDCQGNLIGKKDGQPYASFKSVSRLMNTKTSYLFEKVWGAYWQHYGDTPATETGRNIYSVKKHLIF